MVNMNIVAKDILSVGKLLKGHLTPICMDHTLAHTIASINQAVQIETHMK